MVTNVTVGEAARQQKRDRRNDTDLATLPPMANHLKDIIKRSGIRDADLARRLGIPRQQVFKLKNQRNLKWDWIERLAEALGVDTSEITGEGPSTVNDSKTFTPDINPLLTAIEGTIPVFATDDSVDGGIVMESESDRTIDRKTRTATYAIYAPNDDLRPSCWAGDVLHVDSATRPTIGRFALALLHERDSAGRRRAVLGELIERSPKRLVLRHSHPDRDDIIVSRVDVEEVHAITLIEHA